MAFRLFNIFNSITKSFGHSSSSTNGITSYLKNENFNLVKSCLFSKNIVRQTSFFNKYTAAELWKSSTSVSNQGRARGRGRGTRFMIKDLNRGQVIGVGKVNMLWPGLSGPIMKGSAVVQQQRLPDDPEREAKLIKARKALTKRSRRVHPLERGWTSARLGGRSIGAPDPVGEEKFENFDTKVIEHKIVQHMTGNFGRKRSFSTFAITGNKNGLCGIAIGRSAEAKAALRVAKNRAGQKLMYIERYNDHTVLHDFYTTFGATKVLVEKKPEGFGLRAHRAIVCACQVIGIKDIRCKVEGAMNYQHIIKAFLLGLLKQKSHQQLAEEKQLYLVEMRKENFYYPKVIAKPSVIRKPSEVKSTEITDFNQYVLGGKVVHQKKKYPPFFTSHYSWVLRTRKNEYIRNQDKVKIRLRAEYGELRSFLTDKYPEAKPSSGWWIKNKEEAEI